MKYALLAYAVVVALALSLHSAPPKKGPDCGPGVLCIREQKTVRAELALAPERYTERLLSQAKRQ